MSIEAMKLALAALESWQKTCLDCGRGSDELGRATKPIVALRQAIEQAEQAQPVAIRTPKQGDRVICIEDESIGTVQWISAAGGPYIKFDDSSYGQWSLREFGALFRYADAAPPPRRPLTDEQIMAIGRELGIKCRLGGNSNIDFDYARAIEQAHGIKGQE